jgi:16S rRNA (uracil1498-N3)-methyltransferase
MIWCTVSRLPETLPDEPITLDAEQSRHLSRVLRLRAGERIRLFDGAGRLASAVLLAETPADSARPRKGPGLVAVAVESLEHAPPARPAVTIRSAMPKGPRLDQMLASLTQLGADAWGPIETEHSVRDWSDRRTERLRRIILENAKQARNPRPPRIEPPAPLDELFAPDADRPAALRLFCDLPPESPDAADRDADRPDAEGPDRDAAPLPAETPERIELAVGPEGGWSDEERRRARDAGWRPWAFHPLTLRIETAAAAALAVLRHRYGA